MECRLNLLKDRKVAGFVLCNLVIMVVVVILLKIAGCSVVMKL